MRARSVMCCVAHTLKMTGDVDSKGQKKTYRVLDEICRFCHSFLLLLLLL